MKALTNFNISVLMLIGLSQVFATSTIRSVIPSKAEVPLDSGNAESTAENSESTIPPSTTDHPNSLPNSNLHHLNQLRKKKKTMPPGAIEGIFDDVLRSRRPIRDVHSFPRILLAPPQTSHWAGNEQSLFRERRSLGNAHGIFSTVPMRKKRDLRRLRRDLAHPYGGTIPRLNFPQKPYRNMDYTQRAFDSSDLPPALQYDFPDGLLMELAREKELETERKLNKLLQDLELLEQLSVISQAQQLDEGNEFPANGHNGGVTRFAPQPKVFPDPPIVEESSPIGWGGRDNHAIEKKMSMQAFGYGMSRVPGVKRSSPAFMHKSSAMNQNDVASLATMLGAEVDPKTRRIRRTAM